MIAFHETLVAYKRCTYETVASLYILYPLTAIPLVTKGHRTTSMGPKQEFQ